MWGGSTLALEPPSSGTTEWLNVIVSQIYYCWNPWRPPMRFRCGVASIFIKTYCFVYVKHLACRMCLVVVRSLLRVTFVRRRGTLAMSPSPLCGRIVVFQFYLPSQKSMKNRLGAGGGCLGRLSLSLGRPGWLLGVLRVSPWCITCMHWFVTVVAGAPRSVVSLGHRAGKLG